MNRTIEDFIEELTKVMNDENNIVHLTRMNYIKSVHIGDEKIALIDMKKIQNVIEQFKFGIPAKIFNEAKAFYKQGRNLEAVKHIKFNTDLTLKESKDFYDEFIKDKN